MVLSDWEVLWERNKKKDHGYVIKHSYQDGYPHRNWVKIAQATLIMIFPDFAILIMFF